MISTIRCRNCTNLGISVCHILFYKKNHRRCLSFYRILSLNKPGMLQKQHIFKPRELKLGRLQICPKLAYMPIFIFIFWVFSVFRSIKVGHFYVKLKSHEPRYRKKSLKFAHQYLLDLCIAN